MDKPEDLLHITCPDCGSGEIAKNIYGYPNPSVFDVDSPFYRIKGCVVTEKTPQFFCRKCQTDFDLTD